MDVPGYEWATERGWTLMSYSADRSSGNYMDESGDVLLKIMSKNEALLRVVDGLIVCTIGPFSFPHPSFDNFYNSILKHADLNSKDVQNDYKPR